jgi:SAM-dependent methyltransferase
MPTFPPEEMQRLIHGHAGVHSIRAFKFYVEIRNYALFCERPLAAFRTLMDFGCGWGRILRPFMKDLPGSQLFGCEPDSLRIVTARQCNPYLNFIQSTYLPPLPLRSSSIDFIAAFSVFSHLDEFAANRWIEEFARILAPGGIAFLTTEGTSFFDFAERLKAEKKEKGALQSGWHEGIVRGFPNIEDVRSRHARGEFIFSPTKGVPPTLTAHYGEAAIPRSYVEANWCRTVFHLIDFVDDHRRLPQALIVVQKRNSFQS